MTGAGGLSLGPTAVPSAGYGDNTDAGTASVSYTYPGDANHLTSSDSTTFTIDQRALTITAHDRSKTYGDGLVLGTTGFTTDGNEAIGEQVDNVDLTSISGNDASPTAAAGSYPGDIVPGNATGSRASWPATTTSPTSRAT